jgi:hypothetical protein
MEHHRKVRDFYHLAFSRTFKNAKSETFAASMTTYSLFEALGPSKSQANFGGDY